MSDSVCTLSVWNEIYGYSGVLASIHQFQARKMNVKAFVWFG